MPPKEKDIEDALRRSGRGHPWSGDETPRLTSLDGVGPKTAERLRAAGVEHPSDLQGKSIEEIAAIDGIGRSRAARIRSQVEYTMPGGRSSLAMVIEGEDENEMRGMIHRQSGKTEIDVGGETGVDDLERTVPFASGVGGVGTYPSTVAVTGADKEEAIEAHAERSEAAREADESFNAPITLSYEQWAQNPNRYDYPGVDTIPRSRRRERAMASTRQALDADAIWKFTTTESQTSAYNAAIRRLSLGSDRDPEGTLAHEVGHAMDAKLGDPRAGERPSVGMFQDAESLEQAEYLVERRRGSEPDALRRQYGVNIFEDEDEESPFAGIDTTYEFEQELFADVYASMVTEPRAARREAPKAVAEVESLLHGTGLHRRGQTTREDT